jgi:hypothetical protein
LLHSSVVDAEPERLEDDSILLSRLEHIDACARSPYVLLGIEHMGAFRSVPFVNYSRLAATGTHGVLSQIAEYGLGLLRFAFFFLRAFCRLADLQTGKQSSSDADGSAPDLGKGSDGHCVGQAFASARNTNPH